MEAGRSQSKLAEQLWPPFQGCRLRLVPDSVISLVSESFFSTAFQPEVTGKAGTYELNLGRGAAASLLHARMYYDMLKAYRHPRHPGRKEALDPGLRDLSRSLPQYRLSGRAGTFA